MYQCLLLLLLLHLLRQRLQRHLALVTQREGLVLLAEAHAPPARPLGLRVGG